MALASASGAPSLWGWSDAVPSVSRGWLSVGAMAGKAHCREHQALLEKAKWLRNPLVRYDLKLWIGHSCEGAAYLPR